MMHANIYIRRMGIAATHFSTQGRATSTFVRNRTKELDTKILHDCFFFLACLAAVSSGGITGFLLPFFAAAFAFGWTSRSLALWSSVLVSDFLDLSFSDLHLSFLDLDVSFSDFLDLLDFLSLLDALSLMFLGWRGKKNVLMALCMHNIYNLKGP